MAAINVSFAPVNGTCKGSTAKTILKGFKLDEACKCFDCGQPLSPAEKQYKSVIRYYGAEDKEIGKLETYVCFACAEKFTGRKIKQ